VFRIGTAGGATRASTGYTFSAMHRQARGVAALLRTGQVPEPPPAYPARHRHIDAVLLRGLDRGHVDGTVFFPELFARNPIGRVLDFLDGATTRAEELAVMRSVQALPMLRSMASLAVPSSHG
jgi:lycopene beta-cyclase